MRPNEWNGDPNCLKCRGRGVVPILYRGIPGGATENCDCVYLRDVKANVERVWHGLFKASPIPSSPLFTLDNQDLVITASMPDIRRHLRHVALRKGPNWDARVVTDAALATAWLSTKVDVFDADVLSERQRVVSEEFLTLVDIAVPFDLLIIKLGVKAAKNREMPGVLLEVIHERQHRDKPTWLVESPAYRLRPGHICYDARIEDLVHDWDRVVISEEEDPAALAQDLPSGSGGGFPIPQGSVWGEVGGSVPSPTPVPIQRKPVGYDKETEDEQGRPQKKTALEALEANMTKEDRLRQEGKAKKAKQREGWGKKS